MSTPRTASWEEVRIRHWREVSSSSIHSRQPGVGGLSDCGPGQGQKDTGGADSEERASPEAREYTEPVVP
jgi:hypothetical protein